MIAPEKLKCQRIQILVHEEEREAKAQRYLFCPWDEFLIC